VKDVTGLCSPALRCPWLCTTPLTIFACTACCPVPRRPWPCGLDRCVVCIARRARVSNPFFSVTRDPANQRRGHRKAKCDVEICRGALSFVEHGFALRFCASCSKSWNWDLYTRCRNTVCHCSSSVNLRDLVGEFRSFDAVCVWEDCRRECRVPCRHRVLLRRGGYASPSAFQLRRPTVSADCRCTCMLVGLVAAPPDWPSEGGP